MAEDEAIWGKVRDMIDATFTPEKFQVMVDQFSTAREVQVLEPIQAIKRIAKAEAVKEDTLLKAFMAEPEPTGFGITQALTLAAQDNSLGADDQIRLSRLAGKALAGTTNDWQRLLNGPANIGITDVFEGAATALSN